MSKINFKDKFTEFDSKQKASEAEDKVKQAQAVIEETVQPAELVVEDIKPAPIAEKTFTDTVLIEQVTKNVKQEITEDFKQQLEAGLRQQIEEQIRYDLTNELTSSITKTITENLNESIVETNRLLMGAVQMLSEKVEKLSESMKIEIPTPIVHVNMPKVTRKVNRNEQGLVESISEEYENNN